MKNNILLSFALAHHEKRLRTELLTVPLTPNVQASADFADARWSLLFKAQEKAPGSFACKLVATVESGSPCSVAAGLVWQDEGWSIANQVLMPGAVYGSNRFHSLRRVYPPGIRDLGQRANRQILDIGDVPRLSNEPGRSHLDQTSLDVATPGIGIYSPVRQEAFVVLTPQSTSHGAYGFEIIENADRTSAEILLLSPGFLHPIPGDDSAEPQIGNTASAYLHPENGHPADLSAGESIVLEFEWHTIPCSDINGLFDHLLTHRKTLFSADKPLPKALPFSAAWDLLHTKYNSENWNEEFGLYQVGLPWLPTQVAHQFWQNGWVGGGIATLPMIQEGDGVSLERSLRNLDFLLTDGLSSFGLFKAGMTPRREWISDGKTLDKKRSWSLLRRQGDCLVFVMRQFMLLQDRGHILPVHWVQAVRRVASALCEVWEREGEFGFLINYDTGHVDIRGSTSGALIPAGLALASRFFSEPTFMSVAIASAEQYRVNDLTWGVTTGGPGDAVQAPDGESIFGLVESFVTIFEFTGEPRWLDASRQACAQAASWAISYDYQFPLNSAFAELSIDARGTMIANAQNKCAVPGICTHSGQGLLRTFRATGDVRILNVIRDISHSIPQFISRTDRPLPTRINWGNPCFTHLPPGWICERVNITPSWPEPIGEQAAYSCWCEVAMMLTWSDLPGVYVQSDTGLLCTLDHVYTKWADSERQAISITNPTKFPARVRLMAETSEEALSLILPVNFASELPIVLVPAEETVTFKI